MLKSQVALHQLTRNAAEMPTSCRPLSADFNFYNKYEKNAVDFQIFALLENRLWCPLQPNNVSQCRSPLFINIDDILYILITSISPYRQMSLVLELVLAITMKTGELCYRGRYCYYDCCHTGPVS